MEDRERNAAAINRLRNQCSILQKVVKNFDGDIMASIEELRSLKNTPLFSKFACQTICDRVSSFECQRDINFEVSRYYRIERKVENQYFFTVAFTFRDEDGNAICSGELRYSF